jgi:HPt (histidine-containing phosphotransfer) domain-containing protein
MDALRDHLPKEKLLPLPEEEEEKAMMSSGAAMPDDLPMVEGVDWAACWIHLSNLDVVKDTMKEFYELLIPHMDKLLTFYKSLQINPKYTKAIEGYRIQVHAMKGAANTLGIFPLAGMAKVLEFAAKDEDTERIFQLHPIFQEEWCSYREKLKGVFGIGEEQEMQQAEDWMLESFLSLIENAMEEMDVDAADSALERMKGYQFSVKVQSLMPALSAAVTALDEDAVKSVTAQMREE